MGSGLQDGSLDLNKLMGTVQNMVTRLSDEAGDSEGGDQAMNMITTMMGSLSAGANAPKNDGSQQPMPDLAGMLGPMMGAMLGGAGGNGMPDLAAMFGGAGGNGMPDLAAMFGGAGGNGMPDLAAMMGESTSQSSGNAIENSINAQVDAARNAGKLPSKAE